MGRRIRLEPSHMTTEQLLTRLSVQLRSMTWTAMPQTVAERDRVLEECCHIVEELKSRSSQGTLFA